MIRRISMTRLCALRHAHRFGASYTRLIERRRFVILHCRRRSKENRFHESDLILDTISITSYTMSRNFKVNIHTLTILILTGVFARKRELIIFDLSYNISCRKHHACKKIKLFTSNFYILRHNNKFSIWYTLSKNRP